MNSITLFITCLLSLLPLGVVVGDICMPNCSESKEGDKVRDPTNCLRYFYCTDPEGDGNLVPSDEPMSCPEGYYFNAEPYMRDCDVITIGSDYCTDLCSPCVLECTAPGTMLADPYDCGNFYVCLDGSPSMLLQECPPGDEFFDYILGGCVNDDSNCYDYCDPCQVYCPASGKVVDPYDCQSYYYCDPPNLSHFTCPSGDDFNPVTLLCEPTTGGCNPLCSAVRNITKV